MKSIRSKIFWTFTAVVLAILVLTVFLNTVFFKPFSISQDKAMFREVEDQVKQALNSGTITTDLLSELSAKYGVQLDIVDRTNNQTIYSSSNFSKPMMGQGHGNMMRYRTSFGGLNLSHDNSLGFHQLQTSDGEGVLMLISSLPESMALVVYRPVAMIERIVSQANTFVWWVGLALLGLGGLLIYWLAGRSVRPVLALHQQTDRMAKLDFSDRFEVRGEDEINQLGQNINAISDKLSQTIGTLESDVQKLTEVDRVRKQFVASVSHEFKSPLGIIKGYTEALKYDLVNPSDKEKFLDTILTETDRLDHLVQDLIGQMKREMAKEPPKLEAIEVCPFLSDVIDRHKSLLPDRQYRLECQDVRVLAESAGLMRVLENYLQNAYTYGAPESPIDIRVTPGNDVVRVGVVNQGDRIPEDKKQIIWESFYKIDPSRSEKGGGTGLGLPIARAIITSFGGEVGSENTSNGVEFFFTLPFAQD